MRKRRKRENGGDAKKKNRGPRIIPKIPRKDESKKEK
jgi:hypothetical protein